MRPFSLLAALALPSLAFAADAIRLEYDQSVPQGETPELRIHANEPVRISVDMSCGGASQHYSQSIAEGATANLALPGRWTGDGSTSCSGPLEIVAATGASGSMNLRFDVHVIGGLTLQAGLEDIDLTGGMVTVHAERPLAEVSVRAIGVGGEVVGTGRAHPNSADPRLSWHPNSREVIKLEIEANDGNGALATLTLVPWSYNIPHDDVIFPTNEATIAEAEVPKLESAYGELLEALDKYGSVVDAKLYIGGYTDTVGDPSSNRTLSGRRARAIAQWFRQRGFSGAIFFQGFGESALAVATGDGVDEPRNRRAVYVISANPPQSPDFPSNNWQQAR